MIDSVVGVREVTRVIQPQKSLARVIEYENQLGWEMMTLKAYHRCRYCDQLSSDWDEDLKLVKVKCYLIFVIYYFMFTNNSCIFDQSNEILTL